MALWKPAVHFQQNHVVKLILNYASISEDSFALATDSNLALLVNLLAIKLAKGFLKVYKKGSKLRAVLGVVISENLEIPD